MASFDVVSKVAMEEVDNAVQQAKKEVAQRFDFRGTGTEVERTEEGIVLKSSTEQRLAAALEVLQERCVRRKVSLRALEAGAVEPGARGTFRQLLKIREGISDEKAKELVRFLKGTKLKVQASIQGDAVRVSAKDKDLLQEAIRALRQQDFGLDLQFTNYRD